MTMQPTMDLTPDGTSQGALFDLPEPQRVIRPGMTDPYAEWVGMPEFTQEDQTAAYQCTINFTCDADVRAFERFIGQRIPRNTRSLWYPRQERQNMRSLSYVSGGLPPRYPVYIPSKGRADSRLTMRAFDAMQVPYHVIVEEQEFDAYADALDGPFATILPLDPAYQRDYDACMELAPGQSTGSGPARNFAWDHARATGAARHWVIDDNIQAFYRLNRNLKVKVMDGACFRAMESFVDRYENVAMAGPHYEHFVLRREDNPPFRLNTRVYSCNLIQTDAPFRWRGRYNEDTILSIDMLKAGWCTILFNAFLQNKLATQRLGGGNTDAFYADEGTLPKSRMLVDLHPDVAKLSVKYNRWHHHVNYDHFAGNKLRRRPGVAPIEDADEFGMRLIRLDSPQEGGNGHLPTVS